MLKFFSNASIRTQIFTILIGLSVLISGGMSWISFQSSHDIIERNSISAVGLEANSRKQQLLHLLKELQQYTKSTLDYTFFSCAGKRKSELACQKKIIQQFSKVHLAQTVRLKSHNHILQVTTLDNPPPLTRTSLRANELARFLRGENGVNYFFIQVKSPDTQSEITVQFGLDQVNKIFLNRNNLGKSGESFLTDSEGYFITPARYKQNSGYSHPIHARPMERCLSGESGEVLDLDYRDAPIIHGFQYLPEIGGGCIMAHIDQLLKKLRAAIVSREEFIGIASHELRTPLTSLTMQFELIHKFVKNKDSLNDPSEKLDRLIQGARDQLIRISHLVSDLLDTTRMSSGQIRLHFEKINLSELVNEIIQRYSLELNRAQCSITCVLDSTIFGIWDRFRIEQVIINLLSNALKYGAGKPIKITTQKYGSKALIAVKDCGVGIQKDDQLRIFDRFERVESTAGHIGGMGLGLFITRQIVEAHGGSIRVESEIGKGSTFIIEIPLNANFEKKVS